MFGISGLKWIIIIVAVLIFIPPEKWPEIGRTIGKAIATFRRAQSDMSAIVRAEMSEFDKLAAKPSTEKKKTIAEAKKDQEAEAKEEAGKADTIASTLYTGGASNAEAAASSPAEAEPAAKSDSESADRSDSGDEEERA